MRLLQQSSVKYFSITLTLCFLSSLAHSQSASSPKEEAENVAMERDIPSLTARIAILEEKIAQLKVAAGDDHVVVLDRHDKELQELREQVAEMSAWVRDSQTSTVSNLARELGVYGFLQGGVSGDLVGREFLSGGFYLRRARLGLHGERGPVSYRIEAELSTPALLDFYFDYRLNDHLDIRFGQFKVPFTKSFMLSSAELIFADRAQAVEQFRYTRDIGVAIRGAYDRFSFNVGIFNGAGPNRGPDNKTPGAFARVNAAVVGHDAVLPDHDIQGDSPLRVALGGSGVIDEKAVPGTIANIAVNRDADSDGIFDSVLLASAGLDLTLMYHGWHFTAETTFRHEKWRDTFAMNPGLVNAVGARQNRNYWTFHGHLAKTLIDNRLLAAVRLGHTRLPFFRAGDLTGVVPRSDRAFEGSAILQHYRSGSRVLGLMYSLYRNTNRTTSDPADNISHRILLEAQFKF